MKQNISLKVYSSEEANKRIGDYIEKSALKLKEQLKKHRLSKNIVSVKTKQKEKLYA